MEPFDIRIVRLEPFRVAYALGFGPSPEELAWNAVIAWTQENGLLAEGRQHRFFGFNNPDPSPGSPNYGYEQWVTVGPDAKGSGEVKVKEVPGGLYAVTRCQLKDITATWQRFAAWREESQYRPGPHQYLEEYLGEAVPPDWESTFDLYIPIAE